MKKTTLVILTIALIVGFVGFGRFNTTEDKFTTVATVVEVHDNLVTFEDAQHNVATYSTVGKAEEFVGEKIEVTYQMNHTTNKTKWEVTDAILLN